MTLDCGVGHLTWFGQMLSRPCDWVRNCTIFHMAGRGD